MTSDFAFQMTSDKYRVIQRLAMLEDTQIVYQALLAKLFINEKNRIRRDHEIKP